MSSIQGAKAISTVVEGRIEEKPYARVFNVQGSKGDTHTVVIGAGDIGKDLCTCPAGQHGVRCYHVLSAHLLMREAVEA